MGSPSRAAAARWLLVVLGSALASALVSGLVLGGCTSRVGGSARAGDGVLVAGVDPVGEVGVHGSDGSEVDELAAGTLVDVQSYWDAEYPAAAEVISGTSGSRGASGLRPERDWRALSGGFWSVDTTDPQAPAPPCVQQSIEVEGNAFYCPQADAVAWDRAALLPVLRERHGDGGVVVVLAHEVGHAVHNRLGITPAEQRRRPQRYPRILTETMADCFAGSFVRWVVDGHAGHLRLTPRQLDQAMGALVTFRDPVGTGADGATAHGNAFDRVSAFQDGYRRGVRFCTGFAVTGRAFTLDRFRDGGREGRGANLPFPLLVSAITPDLDAWFGRLVTAHGGQWRAPLVRVAHESESCARRQGPAAYCPAAPGAAGSLEVSDQLTAVHQRIGDFATGTLLASRYGLAAGAALGRPADGAAARARALCLAGAYTGDLLSRTRGFGLSAGDLDEAVQVLLGYDYASRDASGTGLPSGFDRVSEFRAGTLHGAPACPL